LHNAWNTRLKQSVKTYVLNGSNILNRRLNDDCGNKRVLNFDSVLNKHNELIKIINKKYFLIGDFNSIGFILIKKIFIN
jgi:hypothetical protein